MAPLENQMAIFKKLNHDSREVAESGRSSIMAPQTAADAHPASPILPSRVAAFTSYSQALISINYRINAG